MLVIAFCGYICTVYKPSRLKQLWYNLQVLKCCRSSSRPRLCPCTAFIHQNSSNKWEQQTNIKWKKRPERRKHCALAVVRRSQNFSPGKGVWGSGGHPSRVRRTVKIWSAGDGHYLRLQTQFGEDRCTQLRVIVVTDPQTNKHTHKQTNPQTGPITIHCDASLARSVMTYKQSNIQQYTVT